MQALSKILATLEKKGMITMPQFPTPIKVGLFGEQGTGKTTTAALMCAAISKQYCDGAPVWVTDPELGWKFTKKRIFVPEGIHLEQRTVPTFAAMMDDLYKAERAGACCYAAELAKPWIELLETVKRKCRDSWGQELVHHWNQWVTAYMNSPLSAFALARVTDLTEEIENEHGEVKKLKIGEGMKAGGQRNNFGYEPNLVLRMTLERAPRKRKGKLIEDEGRMIHRCDVLKDRSWEINGKVFRWPDQRGYKPGGFARVWKDVESHYVFEQDCEVVKLDASASSDHLIADDGNSQHYRHMLEKKALFEEWDADMDGIAAGRTADAISVRRVLGEAITGHKSRTRMEQCPIDDVQLWVKTLAIVGARWKDDKPTTEEAIRTLIDQVRREMTDAQAGQKTLLERQFEDSLAIAKKYPGNSHQAFKDHAAKTAGR